MILDGRTKVLSHFSLFVWYFVLVPRHKLSPRHHASKRLPVGTAISIETVWVSCFQENFAYFLPHIVIDSTMSLATTWLPNEDRTAKGQLHKSREPQATNICPSASGRSSRAPRLKPLSTSGVKWHNWPLLYTCRYDGVVFVLTAWKRRSRTALFDTA